MQRSTAIPVSNPQREVIVALREYVERKFRADKDAAYHFGCSAAHLSGMLHGRKRIPERICRMLGYELMWVKVVPATQGE